MTTPSPDPGHTLHEASFERPSGSARATFRVERVPGPVGVVVIVLEGELDLAAAPALREAVEAVEAGARAVVLDLAESTFVDSSVLRELLHAQSEVERHGAVLVLAGVPAPVARLL